MATNFLWFPGTSNNGLLVTAFNLMTTELQSVTNTSVAVSSVIHGTGIVTNADTAQGVFADLFFKVGNPGIGSALSAGAAVTGWFMTSPDGGTTFEPTGAALARAADFIIPMPATTITASTTYRTQGQVILPTLEFKVLIQNNTGQTLGTGATTAPALVCAPYALQY